MLSVALENHGRFAADEHGWRPISFLIGVDPGAPVNLEARSIEMDGSMAKPMEAAENRLTRQLPTEPQKQLPSVRELEQHLKGV